ncbi:hypothetical protein N7532_008348, partial [Penicillium argentinense]
MSPSCGILEIPTLAKLTWELYNQCHPLAKDAPDGFRNLVNDLGLLQGNLRTLSEDVSSIAFFFEEMGSGREKTLERCLDACQQTLQRLKSLLGRYRELGIGEGKSFWQRIKWTTQRAQVEDIRSKIIVHTCNVSLCMSSIGDASLDRLEQTIVQAMEDDEHAMLAFEASSGRDSESPIWPRGTRRSLSGENEDTGDIDIIFPDRLHVAPLRQVKQGHGRPRHMSTSSESVRSGSDGSFSGGTARTSPTSIHTTCSYSQSLAGRISHSRTRSEQPHEGFNEGRAHEKIFWEDSSDIQDKNSILDRSSESSHTEFGHNNVLEAVASAMQHLRQVRLQEQLARPIRYEPQSTLHKPDAETIKLFEASMNEELQVRRLITRDWLRVATWWLLKARATLANCSRHSYVSARGSLCPSSDSRSMSPQAYVDLLKSSYILYDIVLKDKNGPAHFTDENRKSIAELSEGMNDELSQYSTLDIPDAEILRSQNLVIWEPLQPEETSDSGLEFSFGLENARWISVNQEDAGNEEEKVLYRTFVNAGIGGKKFRMRTKNAPYMLLLATREGESEPKIILCNQSGSLCLQRDLTPDDLPPMIQLANSTATGFPGARISEPLPFKFENMSISISFQFYADLNQFINIPKTYFDAVWLREPIDSQEFTETILYKGSVEMLEQLNAPIMKPMNPPVVIKSCGVRILERSFGEAWRATRRVVISPSAAQSMPRCLEFFMPMGGVQINREDLSRQVLLRWSDTCQERSDKTDGNYNTLHSYVYDENAPNLGFSIHFRTQQGAEDFEKAIMGLSFQPDFTWTQTSSSGRIHDVIDAGTEHKQYKAIVLFRNRSSWRYLDVFYLYRNVDYAYESSSSTIRFPAISYTDYVSTHVDQLFRAEQPVGFSHCEKRTKQALIRFDCERVSWSFLCALSPLYELVFSRRIQSLTTKGKSFFGSQKSSKGGAEAQLWRRGSGFRLAARWDDHIPDRWFTMSLPLDHSDSSKESNRVNFPRSPYTRGTVLDLVNIMARNPKTTNLGGREGALSIVFQSTKEAAIDDRFRLLGATYE